jgi:multimeric flavodoxin WrbA
MKIQKKSQQNFAQTLNYLKKKKNILFLTTSSRWTGESSSEKPKSTQLAYHLAKRLTKATIIEIPDLKIYPCEGNVSTERGNTCGLQKALLKDKRKNPTGYHRCWASLNNKDDELWKVSKELFQSDCVIFFGSVRWGQMNMYYQKLIERMTWVENRHSTLKENNVIKNIDAGIIAIGQNWNGINTIDTQKKVLDYYGFNVINKLCWNWQYTKPEDENETSYQESAKAFKETFLV